MEHDPVAQGRHAEQPNHIGHTDAGEEVQRLGGGDHHHALLPAPPPQAGYGELETQDDPCHVGEDHGPNVPGEGGLPVLGDQGVGGHGHEHHQHHQVPPGYRGYQPRLGRVKWPQYEKRVEKYYEADYHNHHCRKDVLHQDVDAARKGEDEAVHAGDDKEEESLDRKDDLHVLGGQETLAQRPEEEDVTDGSDETVRDVEDSEDKDEVGGEHGPALLAQHRHVGRQPGLQGGPRVLGERREITVCGRPD